MTVTANHAHLVVAAQAGDRSAREALIAAHLPLLYNVVGRALDGHSDVDDVVQETLLRVLRDLPALRSPESFRSWLVAIALRQIASHRQRVRSAAHRGSAVHPAEQLPHVGNVENEAILRLHVSDQRRQVVEASHWLDPAYRPLLSLWWQECAGRLSRSEVAAATGLTVAHVGVRLQRMREQLETGRSIVAALTADPRCPQLAATVHGWDGSRTPVWRKRITRHLRSCPTCTAPAEGRVAAERLLLGIAPLAVPAGLTAALAAKGILGGTATGTTVLAAAYPGAVVPASLLGKLGQAVAAHPLASAAAGAVLVTGTAVTVAVQPGPPPAPPPAAVAAPTPPTPPTERPVPPSPAAAPTSSAPTSAARSSPRATRPSVPAGTIPVGTWSLESVQPQGRYLTVDGDFAAAGVVRAASRADVRQRATFTVSRGLANADCVTLRAADGRYLRHSNLRLRLSPNEGTPLFREDATFCPRRGAVDGSVTLQSHNYPALVVRHRDDGYWIDVPDGTSTFGAESSFVVRTPWA
ncbi:sigma-70 family RNA polymerase sigma factor [Micromonospora sp. FIMYZ51]|uniref:sigma-70 family RNA polymerase sigma factor n=1 Tax=Micromonospora sp. FIMYZ51 TaxID=3051832 RepID=UPI00311D48C8